MQRTLLADRGEIRVGSRFQAEITHLLKDGKFSIFKIVAIRFNLCFLYRCIRWSQYGGVRSSHVDSGAWAV